MPAAAQLGGLPRLPTLPGNAVDLNRPLASGVQQIERTLPRVDLREVRERRIDELLRREPERFERDPAGAPMRRGELSWIDPEPAALAAAQAAGFVLLRERELGALGTRVVVLQVPAGLASGAALARLRELAPQAEVDFNHVYTGSGEAGAGARGAAGVAPASTPGQASAPTAGTVRIGLVDGAPDTAHPALRATPVVLRGCGRAAHEHGTAVASLLVGRDDRLRGPVAGATLYAADVHCGDGAIDVLADALDWLARERVAVINISLVGPPNRLLERVVKALAARGHLIVAAVGNDGPAAPPLYPAAYPQVVGVTGVDTRWRVLPEALQGPQVMFAALGVDVPVATPQGRVGPARGTSFAAPLVAARLARLHRTPDPGAAAPALHTLAREAIDLGAPGRDPVFGHGLVLPASGPDALAAR